MVPPLRTPTVLQATVTETRNVTGRFSEGCFHRHRTRNPWCSRRLEQDAHQSSSFLRRQSLDIPSSVDIGSAWSARAQHVQVLPPMPSRPPGRHQRLAIVQYGYSTGIGLILFVGTESGHLVYTALGKSETYKETIKGKFQVPSRVWIINTVLVCATVQ